jgi:TM2 domain-containing membrane protein YozV
MATVVTETRRGAAIPACLFAWLLPGAGHLYLRRTVKGLVFLGAIGTLFVLGVAMDARLQMSLGLDDILASLFSLAQMAIGAPYFAARALGFEAGQVTSVTHEYGNTFTAVGGLLNILVILDAYDTAVGRKP